MLRTYLFILIGATAIVGASITAFTFLRPEQTGVSDTWGGVSGLFSPREPSALPAIVEEIDRSEGRESLGLIPLPLQQGGGEEFATDLADLLLKLTEPPQQTSDDGDPIVPSAYSFIPTGLIGMETERPLTPGQQALREYGNSVGLSLTAFADLHGNMPQVLKDQAEDRTDPLKVSALKKLAADFTELGNELSTLDTVPSPVTTAHTALAAAYRDVGNTLGKVPDAQGDQAFLQAVNTYNGSAENLSRRLLALVDVFASNNVGFPSNDPGAIFMFSAQSSF